MIEHAINFSATNSWLGCRRDVTEIAVPTKQLMDLINFCQHIVQSLLLRISFSLRVIISKCCKGKKRGCLSSSPSTSQNISRSRLDPEIRPNVDIKRDGINHSRI